MARVSWWVALATLLQPAPFDDHVRSAREKLELFRELETSEDRTRELKAAINFDPTSPSLKSALIEHYLTNGRLDEARGEMARAREVLVSANRRLPGARETEEQLERLGTEKH